MKKIINILALVLLVVSCASQPDYFNTQEEWATPGLYTIDGKPYKSPAPNKTTGKQINVMDFGAVSGDMTFDNTDSFNQAIESAQPGDEVYVPAGEYYFSGQSHFGKSYLAHIKLKSGVNFIGAGSSETKLISDYQRGKNLKYGTSIILALSQSNIVISGFTLTSVTPDDDLPDPNVSNYNNIVETAPLYGVVIDNSKPTVSHGNFVLDDLLVEKFDRTGIRIRKVRDVRVKNSTIQKATDLGAGGAGYGIAIQGIGPGNDTTGSKIDTLYNVVENCNIVGPYLRHGILVQYYAHNNLITNNTITGTLLDSIDMHGEDEYSNEISFNTITGVRGGAGIGVGNSGATHDAAGPYNYIYQNSITDSKRGMDILYGSPNTLIIENTLDGIEDKGIYLRDANGTVIRNNTISNIKSEEGYGIKVDYATYALEPEKGVPNGIDIQGNTLTAMANGIVVEAHTENYTAGNNTFIDITGEEYLDNNPSFILPPVSDVVVPKSGINVYPTDDNFVTSESKERVQSQNNMKLKASTYEPQYNRMVFMKFDVREMKKENKKVYLKFAAKSKDGLATLAISGSTDYIDWKEDTITWENSRYHEEDIARTVDDGTLTHITDFQFPMAANDFSTYYVDINDYVQSIDSDVFTIIISNNAVEGMYCEVYSKEIKNENYKPNLIYVKQ